MVAAATATLPEYSTLTSVFAGTRVGELRTALASLVQQTHPPAQVVVVVDGPGADHLDGVFAAVEGGWTDGLAPPALVVHRLATNVGLAAALNQGLTVCDRSYVMRLDSDDRAGPRRAEHQLGFLARNPDVDVVSSWYRQFDATMTREQGIRRLPSTHTGIRRLCQWRTPVNHSATTYRRDAVAAAGGYRDGSDPFEDWVLCFDLLRAGRRLHNLPICTTDVRGGDDFVERRRGWRYARAFVATVVGLVRAGHLRPFPAVCQLLVRGPGYLLPRTVLARVLRGLR